MAVTSVASYGSLYPNTESGKMLVMVISVAGVMNMLYIFSILADLMTRHDDRNREVIKGMLKQMEIKPFVAKAKGDDL